MSSRNTLIQSPVTNVTEVPASATVVTLLAAKPGRLGASIYNDSAAALTIKLGAGAAANSKTAVLVGSGGYFEVPYGYVGIITGLWASATGNAYVTEYV